jgi:hypothetical protein
MANLTKEEIKNEILHCGRDIVYFVNNYVFIAPQNKGRSLFKTYEYQDQLLKDFVNFRFNIILKARQIGASEITRAYCLWLILFQRDKEVLILSLKQEVANKFVKKTKHMYDLLPDWLKIASDKVNNRTTIELSNGSSMWAGSSATDGGRSDSLSLLVVDEAAHIDTAEEIWTSASPALSTGGSCIALSTPNGVGNWFHSTYSDAESGLNVFHPIKLMWNVREDRDENWLEKETKGWDKRKIAQEYLCSFLSSGETVINPDDIQRIESEDISEPKHRAGFDRNYYIWKEYEPGKTYLISADVARGDGSDYSSFIVLELGNMEQVAEYKGKPEPDLFADILFSVGQEYGGALVVVENNSYGFSVLTKLIEANYSNLYYSIKSSHEYIDAIEADSRSDTVPGFATTSKTRPIIIAKLEEFIRNKILVLRSKRLISEMRTFVWKDGKATAMRGYNDDLVMPLAIACWVRDVAIIKNGRDIEYKKALLNAMIKTNTKLNTTIPGQIGYKRETDFTKVKEERPEKEFLWLYSK